MKIFNVWFLWFMHLKLCLVKSKSCFCVLSLWISCIIFKKRSCFYIDMNTCLCSQKASTQKLQFPFFKIIAPQSSEHL